jgi:hypothetical protein
MLKTPAPNKVIVVVSKVLKGRREIEYNSTKLAARRTGLVEK